MSLPGAFRVQLKRFWTAGPAVTCIVAALVLVLILGCWGAYQEWDQIARSIVQAEVSRVRSQAERTAGRIETQLLESGETAGLGDGNWDWLREHWARTIPAPDRTHGALVRLDGRIVVHSELSNEGLQLPADWRDRSVDEAGPDVWETSFAGLTTGPRSLDIVVPIDVRGENVGAYHAGLDVGYLEQLITQSRIRSLRGWALVIGGILLVVLLSSLSLYLMTRRATLLEHALALAHARRLTETSQLIFGLAHEIRNPLNAVQLNLFTAERVFRGEATLERDEVLTMLNESVREIERVEDLIRVLLGYARPESEQEELVDVRQELQAVLQFLKPSLQSMHCQMETADSGGPVVVRVARGAVRQVLLNLLNNAREAVPTSAGRIRVGLDSQVDHVELRVSDNGPGVSEAARERIFAPFFSTKPEGTGLGLAVVRSLVERAGGDVHYVAAEYGGATFVVHWPLARQETTEATAA
jgi:two-component system sensor histidine kinase HydH